MRIGMASIVVNNPIEAFKFYTETLGFQEKMYMPDYNLAVIVSKEDPDGTGLLLEPNQNPISSTYQTSLFEAGIPVITLATKDVEAEYQRLTTLGVVFKKEPTTTEWGTDAVFNDTCGNFVQLFQM